MPDEPDSAPPNQSVKDGRTMLCFWGCIWLLLVLGIIVSGHEKSWAQWVVVGTGLPLGVLHLILAIPRTTAAMLGLHGASIFLIILGVLLAVMSVEVALEEVEGVDVGGFPDDAARRLYPHPFRRVALGHGKEGCGVSHTQSSTNPDFPILSIGTRVVALVEVRGDHGRPVHPAGAVGVIASAPGDLWHSYRVRFADGLEVSMKRAELSVLARHTREAIGGGLVEHDLWDHVIYKCIVGSRAYGLDTDASDTDRRGIYLPPADRHWGLFGVPEQLENPATEEVYWEIQKFLILALKANPNVLECLWTPLVEHATPLAQELLDLQSAFLSKLVYQTYNGYVMSQFKKLQADLRNTGQVKPKHVMHLIRLLLAGIGTLRTGEVPVNVGEHRDRLQAIRNGEMSFEEADAWRLELHHQLDAAAEATRLPERPDYERVNAFLIRARHAALDE